MDEPPIIYGRLIQDIERAFGARLTPSIHARLRELGIDFAAPQATYPVELFLRVVEGLGELLAGEVDPALRYRRLGLLFLEGYVRTGTGRALVTLARLIGPRRCLERVGGAVASSGNYFEAETLLLGEHEVLLCTRVLPQFHRFVTPRWRIASEYRLGILEGVLGQLRVAGSVELLAGSATPHETRYRVRWGPT